MRPTWERPTTANRSRSSKVPVALAKASRRRSRNTPSGKFISKIGAKPNGVSQDGSRSGMVTLTARSGLIPGRYKKALPRSRQRSSSPASAPSVQILIIAVFVQELVQRRPLCRRVLKLQLQAERREDSADSRKPKLAG